ncbi:MAG TPA: LuxR family transcriptional regulator [Caldimonas sp.]|nr:LuxR family transcriptional regulator [Caldimonas sp.]
MEPDFLAVLQSGDRSEYQERVIAFTRRLGFDHVSAALITDTPSGTASFDTVHNTPDGYLEAFLKNGKDDPVMQHCKRSSLPIIWDQSTYLRVNRTDKWESQAQFGYRCGIAVAMHLPDGRHYLVGIDRDQPMPSDSCEVTRIVTALHAFTAHAHEAAVRVLRVGNARAEEPVLARDPVLTARELEALRWTVDGRTAHEIGELLHISERTVAIHLIRATRKLGCRNKLHAAVVAVRRGLI